MLSGDLIIKQAEHHIDFSKRLKLAKLFVEGAAKNILKVLAYYKIENNIKNTLTELSKANKISEVMNVEGRIRESIMIILMKFCQMSLKWRADLDSHLKI